MSFTGNMKQAFDFPPSSPDRAINLKVSIRADSLCDLRKALRELEQDIISGFEGSALGGSGCGFTKGYWVYQQHHFKKEAA